MQRITLIFVSLAMLVAAASCAPEQPAAQRFTPGAPSESIRGLLDELRDAARAWQDDGKMVGAEMVVIQGRHIVLHETYGWADREHEIAMSKNTICRIRSMTKPFVGTAVLMLRDEGRLALSDRVATYIPAFDNAASGAITIRQLLTHTAGFVQTGFPKGSAYEYGSLEQAVRDLGEAGPQHEPGERYVYSDGGTATLAYLVERVSGMSCEAFLRLNVFEPLGLEDTYCSVPQDLHHRLRVASTYRWEDDGFAKYWDSENPQAIGFFRGSGGMYSTPLDYARFLYAWSHQQDGFLSETTKEAALRPAPLSGDYGFHWEIYHRDDELGLAFGHGGSDGTIGVSFPEQDLLALYFTQSRATVTVALFERLLFERLGYEEPVEHPTVELDDERLAALTGAYARDALQARISREDDRLRIRVNNGPPLELVPVGEDTLVIPAIRAELQFLFDAEGQVQTMTFIRGDTNLEFQPKR